jgi:hypothetical protein
MPHKLFLREIALELMRLTKAPRVKVGIDRAGYFWFSDGERVVGQSGADRSRLMPLLEFSERVLQPVIVALAISTIRDMPSDLPEWFEAREPEEDA